MIITMPNAHAWPCVGVMRGSIQDGVTIGGMHDDPAVEAAVDFLRAHSRADLRFDEHTHAVKYVVSPEDGRLVAPAMVAMLRALDSVLFVPDEREGAMELTVTLEEFEERSGSPHARLADRWRIYHGEPPDVRWALMTIDATRFEGLFIDGEAFAERNPLAAGEAQLCRDMNRDHLERLRQLCAERGGMAVEKPVMVGLDPRGIDVRSAFDIVRVRFPSAVSNIDEARRALIQT